MQKKRPLSSFVIGLALLAASQGASAIGWARSQQTAVLGQPLDFTAALRLDPGDVVDPACVSADVMIGDVRIAPSSVRVQVDTNNPESFVMRVLGAVVVDEPVLTVTLSIGCPARMSRRFVLLADPPAAPMAPPTLARTAPDGLAGAPVERAAAPSAPTGLPTASAPLAAPAPAAPPRAARPAPARPARAQVNDRPAPRRTAAAPPKTERAAPAARAAVAPAPRLRLDPVEAPPVRAAAASAVEEALSAVAQAASAARATAAAASAAEARMAALETTVAEMRAEAIANRDALTAVRGRLGEAEATNRWITPLLVAVAALLALAAWLAWRLHALQQERQRAWRAGVPGEGAGAGERPSARPATPTSQLPMVTSEIPQPPTPAPLPAWLTSPPPPDRPAPRPAPAAPVQRTMQPVPPTMPVAAPMATAMPEPSAVERTQVLPPQARGDDGSPRDVSIEELLDLEQQAEFFIVLGQDGAAVDLLVDHLRNTGGGSPLPYLKLLEIYRRRGDTEAYERTRARFNHRFNAYAPDWNADLLHGRSLEEYPGVLPRLQQVWPRPLDAMAELEALLFRKSRGELFDLPAYREVLFLYSLARDLLDREALDSGSVDLLLPLADGGEFSATSPHPYFGLERDSVFDSLREDRPTAPVDLDLSEDEPPAMVVEPRRPLR